MESKIRNILFFTLCLIFILLAPVLVLYSQGYRFDFENREVTQTGGLFLRIKPRQAKIYLNDELIKETDFFFNSAFITNLLPKKYNIKVKKEGYFDWEKNLEIRKKEVTEAENIILFPEDINFNLLFKNIENIWLSPDEKNIVFKEKKEGGWELKLYNFEKNLKSHLLKERDVSLQKVDIFDLEFSENGKMIYFDSILKEQLVTFSLEIDREPPFLREAERPLPPPENIIAYEKVKEDVYYLNNLGYLYKANSSFSFPEKITSVPFPIKQETEYRLHYILDDFIFLNEENKFLYLLNNDTKLFENFFEGVKSLKISDGKDKLVHFSDYEIRVFFLEDKKNQPTAKKGEDLFLFRLSEKIENVFWIKSTHLIIVTEQDIKIIEIDNRDRINTISLTTLSYFLNHPPTGGKEEGKTENFKVFWSKTKEKLYLLVGENFWSSNKLTP